MFYLGVDPHKRTCWVPVLDADSQVQGQRKLGTDRATLLAYFGKAPPPAVLGSARSTNGNESGTAGRKRRSPGRGNSRRWLTPVGEHGKVRERTWGSAGSEDRPSKSDEDAPGCASKYGSLRPNR